MDYPVDTLPDASQLKEQGNVAFREKKWEKAVELFTQAIALEPANEVFFSNRSAAQINLQQYTKALEDANKAVELKPTWSRGYLRRGVALYLLQRFEEAAKAYEEGLEHEPGNAQMQTSYNLAKKALKLNSISPEGVLAQVSIAFSKEAPNDILWDIIDQLVDWYTNSNVAALWAGSPASEIAHLTTDEVFKFTERIMARCKPRQFPVIASVKPQSNIEEYATIIKKTYALGVNSVLIDLNALGAQSDSETVLQQNFTKLTNLIGDIPIGIYEAKIPYHRTFSPALLKTFASSANVYYYIDTSIGGTAITDKANSLGNDFQYSFRSYATQGTQLSRCLAQGFSGYAGIGSSFIPKLYSMVCLKNAASNSAPLLAFLSLSEPTYECFYPFNLKIFLKFHLGIEKLEAVSRFPQPSMGTGMEDAILRITHLHDAAKFVVDAMSDSKERAKDKSVLL